MKFPRTLWTSTPVCSFPDSGTRRVMESWLWGSPKPWSPFILKEFLLEGSQGCLQQTSPCVPRAGRGSASLAPGRGRCRADGLGSHLAGRFRGSRRASLPPPSPQLSPCCTSAGIRRVLGISLSRTSNWAEEESQAWRNHDWSWATKR